MQRELSGDYSGHPLRTKFEGGMDHIPMVPIRIRLFKQIRSGSRFWIGDSTEPILVDEIVVNCNLPLIQSKMERFDFTMANRISEMGVPENERPAIIRKLHGVVQVAVPYVPISVIIVDVTVQFSMGIVAPITMIIRDLLAVEIIDWDTWESLETRVQASKFIPAIKSSIEGLGQVKLYSLESTVRKTECAICMKGLDQFEEEEKEGIDQQLMITCLPCSHLFHRDCIVKWLTTCHLCPICRYPMPTEQEQVSEPPLLSEMGLHLPMLLIMSAGYVITVALVCRLLKQP